MEKNDRISLAAALALCLLVAWGLGFLASEQRQMRCEGLAILASQDSFNQALLEIRRKNARAYAVAEMRARSVREMNTLVSEMRLDPFAKAAPK